MLNNFPKKVIIIGSGVAGIAAAMRLCKKGFHVTILETKNFAGGRIYSFKDNTTGELIDNGQHVIIGAYHGFLEILSELGTDIYFKEQKALQVTFYNQSGMKSSLECSILPGKAGMLFGLLRLKNLSLLSKISIGKFFLKIQNNHIFPNQTSRDLLIHENQNADTIKNFWEPLIYATLNISPDEAASSLLIEVLRSGFFADRFSSRMMLPTVDLSRFLKHLNKWLSLHNSNIIFKSTAKEFLIENNKFKSVIMDSGEEIVGDYFISAVPPNVLKKLLSKKEQVQRVKENSEISLLQIQESPSYEPLRDSCIRRNDELRELCQILDSYKFSTIINIYYWLDKHIQTDDFAAMTDCTSHWLFNRRNYIKADSDIQEKYPGLISVTISGANNLVDISSSELSKKCWEEIKRAIPDFKTAKILHYKVIKDKHATFIASPELEPNRLKQRTSISNFFVAGDWTATNLPATLEGAVQSGFKCAEMICET